MHRSLLKTETQEANALPIEAFTILNLEGWLRGEFALHTLEERLAGFHDPGNILFALELSDPIPVHDSCDIAAQSFAVHSSATKRYIRKAAAFMKRHSSSDWVIPKRFGDEITANIGPLPVAARPIYLISAETSTTKEIVYVGRTAAKDGRFRGGHHAITKLHAPNYDGTTKRVYMASVLVRTEETEWINLELIRPDSNAELYLSEIELNLIYSLQPALNDQGKTECIARMQHPVEIYDPYGLVPRSEWVWPRNNRLGK